MLETKNIAKEMQSIFSGLSVDLTWMRKELVNFKVSQQKVFKLEYREKGMKKRELMQSK